MESGSTAVTIARRGEANAREAPADCAAERHLSMIGGRTVFTACRGSRNRFHAGNKTRMPEAAIPSAFE